MIDVPTRFEMRVEAQLLDRIDAWRAAQIDLPSRSEAVRRLAVTGLESNTGRQLFEIARFNVLAASLAEGAGGRLPDAYVYAWEDRVYPRHDQGSTLHEPFGNYFNVTEKLGDELATFLDDRWTKKKVPTFYELEDHFEVRLRRNEWDRGKLISACRYMFLHDLFDAAFWKMLLKPTQHPSAAASIMRKFERKNAVWFA